METWQCLINFDNSISNFNKTGLYENCLLQSSTICDTFLIKCVQISLQYYSEQTGRLCSRQDGPNKTRSWPTLLLIVKMWV